MRKINNKVKRHQTVETSLIPYGRPSSAWDDEKEEEEERGAVKRRPPFQIELTERSLVALCCFCGPFALAALLIILVNLFTNWKGVQFFAWAMLRNVQTVADVCTNLLIYAAWVLLAWAVLKLLRSFSELIIYTGHGIADIAGKFKHHQVLVAHDDYMAIASPGGGHVFHQVGQVQDRRDMVKLGEQPLPLLPPAPTIETPTALSPTERINLSREYQMHVDEMLSQRGLLVGTSGSGKSGTTAVILEDLFPLGVPSLVFDTEGEYSRLPAFLGRGVTLEASHLSASDAQDFGRHLIAGHKQVVLNLASYEDLNEAARVMCGALAGIARWEEERENEVRVAVMVFLTEAHRWFPQYVSENQLSAEVYQLMQMAFLTSLVRRGRKRGMGLIFDTQKLQEVDKRLLQPDWKVCLRQTEDRSLERYSKWGIKPDEAMSLRNGQGYVYSTRVAKLLVQVARRRSPDDSKSPGLASIRNHRPERADERPELSELWTPRSERFDEPLEGVRQEFGRSERSQLAQDAPPDTTKKARRELSERQQQQVRELYEQGMGRKKIQAHLHVAGDQYWHLIEVCDDMDRDREGA